MANLVSFADGNFSGASTFRGVDTGLSVATFNLTNPQTLSTTSLLLSPSLTSSGASVEGILVYVQAIAGQSGNLTVGLSNNGTSNNIASVQVSFSDVPLTPTVMFFKFGSATGALSGNYQVGIQASVANAFKVYKASATANDWFRLLRSASSATAAAADQTWIAGDFTGISTFATRTVTMDVTTGTATNFGQFAVGNKGVFAWGVTGNTNYRLRIASGNACVVLGNGVMTMGTATTPVPAYTTATLDFESASTSASGLEIRGGTLQTYGSQLKQAWVTNVAGSGTVATLTTATSHGFIVGERVTVSGLTNTGFNGSFTIATVPTTTTFTYSNGTSLGSTGDNGVASIQATVSNKQLSGNAAILTTSAAHGLSAGYWINVTGVDTALNGNWQILAVPTTTTLVYGVVTGYTQNITNAVLTGNVVTLTTASYHGFSAGDTIVVNCTSNTTYNGAGNQIFTIISVPSATTLTYGLTNANIGTAAATGQVTDLPGVPIISKGLTSNTATLTTKYPHQFAAGESVVVTSVDATFNGTFTIGIPTTATGQNSQTFPSPNQFTYSVTASNISTTTTYNNVGSASPANIASQAASGTIIVTKAPGVVYLAADRSSGAATLTTNIPTNWIAGTTVSTGQNLLGNGDSVTLASTTTNSAQAELFKAISTITMTSPGNNPASTITVQANTTNFHSGTINANQDTRAELINVTRNVKITGAVANAVTNAAQAPGTFTSTTGYLFSDEGATMVCYYTEFEWFGGGGTGSVGNLPATAGKEGIAIRPSPTASVGGSSLVGMAILYGCAFHDGGSSGYCVYIETGEVTSNTIDAILLQYCVGSNTSFAFVEQDSVNASGLNIFIDNCCSIRNGNGAANQGLCQTSDNAVNISNCNCAGPNTGITMTENTGATTYNGSGQLANIIIHGSDGSGINWNVSNNNNNMNCSNLRTWRNAGAGVTSAALNNAIIDGFHSFGNSNTGWNFANGNGSYNTVIRNVYMDLGVTQNAVAGVQVIGINFGNTGVFRDVLILNGVFGGQQAHTTADFVLAANMAYISILCNNVSLQSATPISNFTFVAGTNFFEQSKFGFTRFNQQAGNHRTVYIYGTIFSDTTLFKTASPSEKLSPTTCTLTNRLKLESSPKRAALANGQNTTVGVWVRQSVVGDGATYNGQFPQLILKANPGAGIFTDQLIATGTTSGQGSFEQLTGLTPTVTDDSVLEFVVQCNGTVGFVNVDDWTVT